MLTNLNNLPEYDCIIGAVAHKDFFNFDSITFQKILKPQGLIADIKQIWKPSQLPDGANYWKL